MNISVSQLKEQLQQIKENDAELEIAVSSSPLRYKINLEELKHALGLTPFSSPGNKASITMPLSPDSSGLLEPPHAPGLQRALVSPSKMIDLSDEKAVTRHLIQCFQNLQQLTCKTIAKAWIRQIIPKKQSLYPYKGGLSTKPPWWPEDVPHREPDHLMKSQRVSLMITIILTKGLVDTSSLLKSTSGSNSLIPERKRPVMEEIYFIKDKLDREETDFLEVSDFSLSKTIKTSITTNSSRFFIPAPNDLGAGLGRTRKLKIPKFDDENIQDACNQAAFSAGKLNKGVSDNNNEGDNRKPLATKDQNVPSTAEGSRLEIAAWRKLNKLYDDSISLSPGHILSFAPAQLDMDAQKPSYLLPPMKMMHLNSSSKARNTDRLVEDSDTGNDTDIDPLIKDK